VEETQIVQSYLQSLAALARLRGLYAGGTIIPGREHQAGGELMLYVEALDRAAAALPRWAAAAVPGTDASEFLQRPLDTLR